MSSRKSRPPSDDNDSSGPRIPPIPQQNRRHSDDEYYRSSKKPRRRSRYGSGKGYEMGREKLTKVDLLLCVFNGAPSHRWRTFPYSFDRRRINDVELWEDIRAIYRDDLQKAWRRIFGLKKLKAIIPIEVHNPAIFHGSDKVMPSNNEEWAHETICKLTLGWATLVHSEQRPNTKGLQR